MLDEFVSVDASFVEPANDTRFLLATGMEDKIAEVQPFSAVIVALVLTVVNVVE